MISMTIDFDEKGLGQIICLAVKLSREFPYGTPEQVTHGILTGIKKAPLTVSEDGVHAKLG